MAAEHRTSQRLHFITVNFHCSDLIADLIEATAGSGDHDHRFIVINNSPGDTALLPLTQLPGVTLLQAGSNLGFGSGCNLGLEHLWRQDPQALAWLINPDAKLLPGAIDTVRACLRDDPTIAILGTRIQELNGALWFESGSFNPMLGRLRHRGTAADLSSRPVGTLPTDWLSGCSMVFNLAAFGHCPRFDPQMFLDYEDAEICLRYRRLGQRVRVTQAVLVEHEVSAITRRVPGAKYRHATFSKLYLLHRHATPLALILNLLYFGLRPFTFLHRDPAMARGRWAGLADYLCWLSRRLGGDRATRHPRTRFTASS